MARTAAGKEIRGPLHKLAAGWSVEIGKGTRHTVAGSELICLRQQGVALPPLPCEEHVILANGDLISVQNLRLDDEKLVFRDKELFGDEEVSLPLSAVAVIWFSAPERVVHPERFRRVLLSAKRPRDRVLLRNGDSLEGTFNALSAESVGVEVGKKTVTARRPQVAAIALSTELVDRQQPKGVYARVVLADTESSRGSRLTLTSATCEAGVVRGKTVLGTPVRFPVDRLVQLEILGGKAVRLVDIKPAKYEYRPYLDEQWTWSRDGNVMGRDFRLSGSTWEHGVGMHAHSLLHFPLDGAYRGFEALVGLDDRDGRKGRVRVRVLLDGKPLDLGKKDVLTRSAGPLSVRVSVEGGKTLTLEVENGEDGPVQGVVNWVDARLIR